MEPNKELSVHKRRWCFSRGAEFITSQILKEPIPATSDHYNPPEEPEELPEEMLGDRIELPPLVSRRVAWDENSYYQHGYAPGEDGYPKQHTSDTISFYAIPEPDQLEFDDMGNYHNPDLRTEG